MRSCRLHIRLFDEDKKRIQTIRQNTSATSDSEAVRDSLETMDIIWGNKKTGGSITLRNEQLMMEHEVFIGTHNNSHNRLHPTEGCIEVRLQLRDLQRLDDLVRSGAGMNRSHVVREALCTHAHIASHISEGWTLFELHSSGKRAICRIASFRYIAEPEAGTFRASERNTRNGKLLRLTVNKDYLEDEEWKFVVSKELRGDMNVFSRSTGFDRRSAIDQCIRVGLMKIMNDASRAPLHNVVNWPMGFQEYELGGGG